MKLNNRYKRSIKANLLFYVAASVMTMVALLAFYLFYIAGNGINSYADDFFKSQKLEDAQFTAFLPMAEEDISDYEDKYDLTLEAEKYCNFEEDSYTARIFKSNEKIDLYEVIEGEDVSSDDDIIISAGYAKQNGVGIGDSIEVNGKSYTVSGTFLRPDYLYMLEELSDSYKNVDTFFLGYVTDSEFERIVENASINYKVIYGDKDAETDFRREMNDSYHLLSYVTADSNARIKMVHNQANTYISWAWMMLIALPLITVILISIVISRKIRSEQRLIGTLAALGYKKSTLILHYSLLAVIPGVFGGILVTVMCLLIAQPYGELTLIDYEPLQAKFSMPFSAAMIGIIVPSVIYFCSAALKIRKLMKYDIAELLNKAAGERSGSNKLLVNSDSKVKFKLAARSLISNKGRTFVVFLGIFLGAFIVSLGLMFSDSVKGIGDAVKESYGDMEYEYLLNTIRTDEMSEGETVIAGSFENTENAGFTLLGIDSDTKLWELGLVGGGEADIEKGWYASSLCSIVLGINEGDEVTIRNVTTLEEHSIKIEGIIENGYNNYIVSTKERAEELTGLEAGSYNAVISNKKLDIDSNDVSYILTKDTLKKQMDSMLGENSSLISTILVIAAIICVSSLFIAISLLISENSTNISMLKVLGYNDRKISGMLLDLNQVLLIPGIGLGIGLGYAALMAYKNRYAALVNAVLPVKLSLSDVIITIVFVCLCYYVSLFFLKMKVNKVNMAESLMDTRE